MAAEETSAAGVDPFEYRQAIARFATGVAVVTAGDHGHGPSGMTANAVSSVSLSPVLLLVCIAEHLPTHRAVQATGRFNINLLGADQRHLAHQFARPAQDKFRGVRLIPGRTVPLLADALAYFECELYDEHPAGDHSIFIGHVLACGTRKQPSPDPLLYFHSAFWGLAPPETKETQCL